MDTITVNKAAQQLGRDPRLVRGVAIGLGISLTPIASGLCMSARDFERVRDRLARADRAIPVAGAR